MGLSNPANDCFINAVLQALAGSGKLREWLRQDLVKSAGELETVHSKVSSPDGPVKPRSPMSSGLVSNALNGVLGDLSQDVSYRKTLSAVPFIRSLEVALATRLNRRQQDAHELLQIVLDRLRDEYNERASLHSMILTSRQQARVNVEGTSCDVGTNASSPSPHRDNSGQDLETAFPFEGNLESQVECLTCHYTPPSSVSSFVMLSLSVPRRGSTSLDECFDTLLKQEVIEDYRCDRCRLEHARRSKTQDLRRASATRKEALEAELQQLNRCLAEGAESQREDITLPPSSLSPTQRVAKRIRISNYPQVLAVHLPRSIFTAGNWASKNTAKVTFKEHLTLGGFERVHYRLACMVTHLGRHDSGHYETYRRQDASATDNGNGLRFSGQPDRFTGELQGTEGASGMQNEPAELPTHRRPKEYTRLRRWWRISDENVSECRTADVVALERQVYLLIFEKVD